MKAAFWLRNNNNSNLSAHSTYLRFGLLFNFLVIFRYIGSSFFLKDTEVKLMEIGNLEDLMLFKIRI